MTNNMDLSLEREESRTFYQAAWQRLRKNHLALFGLFIVAVLVIVAIAAPKLSPYDPNKIDLDNLLKPVGTPGHILGTDDHGRDVLSRLIHGTRVSLQVGVMVVVLSGSIGVIAGAVAGYYGGLLDNALMRLVDVLYAFPFFILAIGIAVVLGPGLTNAMLALGLASWTGYARLVRAQVLSLREQEFVQSARAAGASDSTIIFRHILPNCLSPIIVEATFGVAGAVLSASGLSYLGMGAQPPQAEWGAMLSNGFPFMREAPHLTILPGLCIMITVLAFNLLGDGLRDAFDPRMNA